MEHVSQTREERRLRLLQRGGLFTEQTKGTRFTRATSVKDLKQGYALVHDVFVDSGFILASKSRMRVRPWELSEDTATFVAKLEEETVGVFSIISDSNDLGLPSDGPFGPELDQLRCAERAICELTSQAIRKEFRSSAVVTELTRCTFAQAWVTQATELVCAISPSQRKFYELIGFRQVGKIKSYSTEIDDPVALMWLEDVQNRWTGGVTQREPIEAFWREFFFLKNPYLNEIAEWNRRNSLTFENPNALSRLFENCEDLLRKATPAQLSAMERRLGPAFEVTYFSEDGYETGWA